MCGGRGGRKEGRRGGRRKRTERESVQELLTVALINAMMWLWK